MRGRGREREEGGGEKSGKREGGRDFCDSFTP